MKISIRSLAGYALSAMLLLVAPLALAQPAAAATLAITSTSPLDSGVVGSPYAVTLAATGGTAPYTWSLVSGTLPNGVALAPTTGAIVGIPTTAATFSVLIQVTDFAATTAFAPFTITIAATIAPLVVSTPTALPGGMVSSVYSQTLAATGGVPPYAWSLVTGTLPVGLTLSSSGVIGGTPTAQGTSTFTVQVADSKLTKALKILTLAISPIGPVRSGVLSQVTSGGGWKTSIYLINTSSSPVPIVVNFWSDSGVLLPLPVTVTQGGVSQVSTGSSVTGIVASNDTLLIESDTGASTETTGWAEVIGTGPITGYGEFHYTSPAGVGSVGTLPLESASESSFILPYDGVGLETGVALTNLAADHPINVTATVWGNGGKQLYSQRINLPANGHSSFILKSSFPGTAGNRGIVEFTAASSGIITGLGLRVDPTGGITSIPLLQRP